MRVATGGGHSVELEEECDLPEILFQSFTTQVTWASAKSVNAIQSSVFVTVAPLNKLKYGKPRLGESTLT